MFPLKGTFIFTEESEGRNVLGEGNWISGASFFGDFFFNFYFFYRVLLIRFNSYISQTGIIISSSFGKQNWYDQPLLAVRVVISH